MTRSTITTGKGGGGTTKQTLSRLQSLLYRFHLFRYLFKPPRIPWTDLDTCTTSSNTCGCAEISVKKLKMIGSSSVSRCWGGVSTQVPCIQRMNSLVLKYSERGIYLILLLKLVTIQEFKWASNCSFTCHVRIP